MVSAIAVLWFPRPKMLISEAPGYNIDPHRAQSVTTAAASSYSQTASSNPSLYQGRIAPQYNDGRHMSSPPSSSYNPGLRRISLPYNTPQQSDYQVPTSNTMPPLSGLAHTLPLSSMGPTNMHGVPQQYSSSTPR